MTNADCFYFSLFYVNTYVALIYVRYLWGIYVCMYVCIYVYAHTFTETHACMHV